MRPYTGGKFAGKFRIDGENRHIFRLRKVEDTVNRREKGQIIKTDQFLINLELDVPITDLMDYGDPDAMRERGNDAMSLLNGNTRVLDEERFVEPTGEIGASAVDDAAQIAANRDGGGLVRVSRILRSHWKKKTTCWTR